MKLQLLIEINKQSCFLILKIQTEDFHALIESLNRDYVCQNQGFDDPGYGGWGAIQKPGKSRLIEDFALILKHVFN